MNVGKNYLKAEPAQTRFEFINEGLKGAIRKLIEFQETTDLGLFNLPFREDVGVMQTPGDFTWTFLS